MKRAFTTGVALAGLAVLGVGAAGSAGAAPVRYGAISYSPSTNVRNFWNNLPQGDLAKDAAVGRCTTNAKQADCANPNHVVVFRGNTWGALAIGSNKKFGLKIGNGKELAKLNAVMACSAAGGTSCKWRLAVPSAGNVEKQ